MRREHVHVVFWPNDYHVFALESLFNLREEPIIRRETTNEDNILDMVMSKNRSMVSNVCSP